MDYNFVVAKRRKERKEKLNRQTSDSFKKWMSDIDRRREKKLNKR